MCLKVFTLKFQRPLQKLSWHLKLYNEASSSVMSRMTRHALCGSNFNPKQIRKQLTLKSAPGPFGAGIELNKNLWTLPSSTHKRLLRQIELDKFPLAEKLAYYNEADGILNALIIDEQEDTNEEEDTKTTIADQRDYKQKDRIHHINWLKINYGDGFIPARYKSEQDQISEFGDQLENELSQWSQSDPIYWYKGSSFFVVPPPHQHRPGLAA